MGKQKLLTKLPLASTYWLHQGLNQPGLSVAAKQGEKWDVVIIGAGITGASVAYHLGNLDKNLSILVVDARDSISGGATGRNGGLLWPTLPTLERVAHQTGPIHTKTQNQIDLFQFSLLNQIGMNEFTQSLKLSGNQINPNLSYFRDGGIRLFHNESELQHVSWSLDELRSYGLNLKAKIIDSKQARPFATHQNVKRTPRKVIGGLYDPNVQKLSPANLVFQLLEKTRQSVKKFEIRLNSSIDLVDAPLIYFEKKEAHRIQADNIIYAMNGYTKDLMPEIPITPIRNQVIVTKPVRNLPYDAAVMSNNGFEYLATRNDNTVLLGGFRHVSPTMEVNNCDDGTLNPAVSTALRAHLSDTFQIPLEVQHEWTGIMGFTPDRLPLVGRLSQGVFIAAGFSGMGMCKSFLACKGLAAQILDKPHCLGHVFKLFDPARKFENHDDFKSKL